MDTKGFVWYLFQKEVMFFMLGLGVGIFLSILAIQGSLPIGIDLCGMFGPVVAP